MDNDNKVSVADPQHVLAANAAIMAEIIELLDDENRVKARAVIAKHTGAKTPVATTVGDMWLKTLTDSKADEDKRAMARKNIIKRIFLGAGFTIKEGQTDLKDYVYKAANRLIDQIEMNFRKVGACVIFLAGKADVKEIEHYEAMEKRANWSTVQWAKHLGATEDDQHRVVFGSWYALDRMLELRDKEHMRQAFVRAHEQGLV